MPCPDCEQTLVYHEEKGVLYCPKCLQLPVADPDWIKRQAADIQDQYLNHDDLLVLLEEYGTFRVVGTLTFELNKGAAGMITDNRLSVTQFFHSLPIVKAVYENADRFNDYFDPRNDHVQEELHEKVEAFLNDATGLITILNQVQEEFCIPIELTPIHGTWKDFFANFLFPHSEYWLCSERCLKANIGAREEIREDFMLKEVIFRSFDRPEKDEIDSVRDWADHWYGLQVSLGFTSALDETVSDAFTTDFPDSVTIFDLEELLDKMTEAVQSTIAEAEPGDFRAVSVPEHKFDDIGEEVFGASWEDVKSSITLSPENPDAHPLFFKISGTKAMEVRGGRRTRRVPHKRIVYPDQFSQLVKMQLFPFLENGDLEKSTSALAALTERRGEDFERYVYEFLAETTCDAYHSCKTSKQSGKEIDTIFRKDGTVYFVESKFMLPKLNMQSQEGIKNVDQAFDEKIFKEGTDRGGKPFPEKVEAWRELDASAEISHQVSRDESDRRQIQVPEAWVDGDFEMLVVSNFTPSYLEKQGVRFLTDLELYQWVENEEDVFYDVLTGGLST